MPSDTCSAAPQINEPARPIPSGFVTSPAFAGLKKFSVTKADDIALIITTKDVLAFVVNTVFKDRASKSFRDSGF
jgi:hypothetical protein